MKNPPVSHWLCFSSELFCLVGISLIIFTKLGQAYVFTHVCDSVHRGVSASVHAGIHPQAQTPSESRPPQEQAHISQHALLPGGRRGGVLLGGEGTLSILLKCILVVFTISIVFDFLSGLSENVTRDVIKNLLIKIFYWFLHFTIKIK